jgi:hypothetical protein
MPSGDGHERRLDSWKEIAAYLRRDERTAGRWEKEKGLPVHRVPGGRRQMVFAYAEELDVWLRQEGQRERDQTSPATTSVQPSRAARYVKWKHAPLVSLIASVFVLIALIAFSWRAAAPHSIAKVAFTGNSLQAWDERDRLSWTYTFTASLDSSVIGGSHALESLVRIADLTGNGDQQVLVVAPFRNGPNPTDLPRVEVDCFSRRGRLLWSYTPNEKYRFGDHELEGWTIRDLFLSTAGPKRNIWISVAHYIWGNSLVVQLDPEDGKPTIRFVNTGIVHKLDELRTPRGTYLLAAGFNNEYEAGSLALMDERKPFAASPQTPGTRHECSSCPKGVPDYYFVFPRTEINELEKVYEDSVRNIHVYRDGFEVDKYELQEGNPRTSYSFEVEPTVRPTTFRFDSSYDMLHRELEAEKRLKHTLALCPDRLNPKPVRMWTPAKGWSQFDFRPIRDTN